MIVPQYWAEARLQKRTGNRQLTLRRFGWSDVSQEEAQRHAERRVAEAMAVADSNPGILRREPKRPYNGADGVPIREEIVDRVGSCVITRNAYGARCLNTPNVLFADIDFRHELPDLWVGIVAVVSVMTGLALGWGVWHWAALAAAVVMGTLGVLSLAKVLYRRVILRPGGPQQAALGRVRRFIDRHRDWHVRVYRTPAGLRILGLHRTFSPQDPEVSKFFQAVGVDRVYSRMCQRQNCFRARVSAKPWRIGIADRLRPRRGGWPVAPELLPVRSAWVKDYERVAAGYSACQFLESVGSGRIDRDARFVQQVHDELSQATEAKPLA